jgi:hypothetical protein
MANLNDDFYVKHTITLPRTSKLTEELIQQLDHILDYASPEEYRNTLIEIYHNYICNEHDALPYKFKPMADQMYFLINFLLTASKEMNGAGEAELTETRTVL